MKRVVFVLFAIFCSQRIAYSQDICITFNMSNAPCSKEDTLAPYLVIEYTNKSREDYYLPSLLIEGVRIPYFGALLKQLHIFDRSSKSVERISKLKEDASFFYKKRYTLAIDFIEKPTIPIWIVETNPPDGEIEYINYYLAAYYDQFTDDCLFSSFCYTEAQLNSEEYIRNSPAFVFLRAGECVIQYVSMQGLKDASVCLEVFLSATRPPLSMPVGDWPQHSVSLPKKVKGYSLYAKEIYSNRLVVDFSRDAESGSYNKKR